MHVRRNLDNLDIIEMYRDGDKRYLCDVRVCAHCFSVRMQLGIMNVIHVRVNNDSN